MGFIGWLDSQPMLHRVMDRFGGRALANAVLTHLPIERHLPNGIVYRHRNVDSIVLADELFRRRMYDQFVQPSVRTFADLGCNVGYFVALVAAIAGRRDLRGVAIDANPAMVRETRWLVGRNRLDEVSVVQGLIGAGRSGEARDFYINDCSIRSSSHPVRDSVDGPGWTRTSAATVDLGLLWQALLGDQPCDLLKIDVEGAEVDVISPDNGFLARVNSILLEWHAWTTSSSEMRARLEALGFVLAAELPIHPEHGLLYARRPV